MSEVEPGPAVNLELFQIWSSAGKLEAVPGITVADVPGRGYFLDPQDEPEHPYNLGSADAENLIVRVATDETVPALILSRRLYLASLALGDIDRDYASVGDDDEAMCLRAPQRQPVDRLALVGLVERHDLEVRHISGAPLSLNFRTRRSGQDNRVNLFFLYQDARIELISGIGRSAQSHLVRYDLATGELHIKTKPQGESSSNGEEGGGFPPSNDREPRRPIRPIDSAAVELAVPLEETEPLVLQGKAA